MYDRTYNLLQKLNNVAPQKWEIQIKKPDGGMFCIPLITTELDLLSALHDLNREFSKNELVFLETFLYSLNVHPDDMRYVYMNGMGWSWDSCYDSDSPMFIDHEDYESEIRGRDVVFIWKFKQNPVFDIGSY